MNSERAMHILKENGFKQTKQREKLLDIFQKRSQYSAVTDLWKEFREDFPSASYDTVYRNLNTMAELGILEMTTIDGDKHFRFHCNIEGHHHHFICKQCGITKAIDVCPIADVKTVLPGGYTIENHNFEVYGICPACQ